MTWLILLLILGAFALLREIWRETFPTRLSREQQWVSDRWLVPPAQKLELWNKEFPGVPIPSNIARAFVEPTGEERIDAELAIDDEDYSPTLD